MNLLIVIFGLTTILAIVGTYQAFKERNFLGVFFNAATVLVFGFFSVATVIFQGYPPGLH
ncbi:DUF2759 domain-containing protein [Chryseomicrobium aureum]|uniref:DUF2759 domain-containing protein n=1 Tax=Chryseomicrobium aureum TaxID=1441723 RepID=UPI00195DDDF5|nr:DUF2759 domain-containing protein [Chryseomicrobium aureum]MBM7705727.1 4-amino-4-deoxy-L-arabinose transferase-like glycosyltransferase [Chryseomicrobium aureum]